MTLAQYALLCLSLLTGGTTVCGVELQCSVSPAGALHPVQGQLERFEVGPGCAARGAGAKETHVISLGRASHSPDKKVTVLLRPITFSRTSSRPVVLVLSSQHAVHWWLESEGLPPSLPVWVQLTPNSTVESSSVALRVQLVPTLPSRPRALLNWSLQHHSSISSLIHTPRANHVYLRLGEDPTMPSVCQLQSLFLSHNYLASILQPQEVQGCIPSTEDKDPEIHVIRLWSAGSGLCGSLQVEVSVSLLPLVANTGWYNVVLIFSSAVPVNWALVAPGVRGHISVYSSHSVTPLYPPKPDLIMTTTRPSDLFSTPDLLRWAKEKGFRHVTSYTEAKLANRFVIHLARGDTDKTLSEHSASKELHAPFPQRKGLEVRHGLSHEDDEYDEDDDEDEDDEALSREAVSAQCQDGRLNVAVDRQILQTLSFPVLTVTLRDLNCKAQSNGSHFLLAFPVISCGTKGFPGRGPGGVLYKNVFSCLATGPTPVYLPQSSPSPEPVDTPWRETGLGPPWVSGSHTSPPLSLRLFVSEAYEQNPVGPCVITAHNRVYVEISAREGAKARVEVESCVVSPLSDPRAHPGWPVIRDSCSVDPSFILTPVRTEGERSRGRAGEEESYEKEIGEEMREGEVRDPTIKHFVKPSRRGGGGANGGKEREIRKDGGRRPKGKRLRVREREKRGAEPEERTRDERKEESHRLRFSFVLRPVYNNSIQFLHCRLWQCSSGAQTEGPTEATPQAVCPDGSPVPALIARPATPQCENRNLSRPVLVTYADGLAGLAGLLAPPTGVDTGPVLMIVFAAFLIGICLMGALWFIYSRTGKAMAVRRDSILETMDQTTGTWNMAGLLDQTNSSV
ncbi:transforming growth factor beta receptor type 3 [Chanos chanos]|uniref:Transforming growth factor beta receptor type 3 n=1 Tax=Chanos chanos TaxID=29144 RepID=A0A6J2WZP2_CHACN|nr:transforming growth factor beta receptor type 3-like [Chanos chanos]